MRTVYAAPGSSEQQVGGDCPAGWVKMSTERPSPNHMATELGEWVERPLTEQDYDEAMMEVFQTTAEAMRYKSWETCSLRAHKPGPFQVECTAFFDWMEACNVKAYAILAAVNSGKRQQPSINDFLAELPVFIRPEQGSDA